MEACLTSKASTHRVVHFLAWYFDGDTPMPQACTCTLTKPTTKKNFYGIICMIAPYCLFFRILSNRTLKIAWETHINEWEELKTAAKRARTELDTKFRKKDGTIEDA